MTQSEFLPTAGRLNPAFFSQSTPAVARGLIGMALVSRIDSDEGVGGIIVETEAYLSQADPASHSARGMTRRNRSMFQRPGTSYVYTIHSKHCFNITTGPEGRGSAVLVRALQPVWNVQQMMQRRGTESLARLTSGPAMLCQALAIDLRHDGDSVIDSEALTVCRIFPRRPRSLQIVAGPRIGISQARDLPLRFFVDRNAFVSGRAGHHSGPRDQQIDLSRHRRIGLR